VGDRPAPTFRQLLHNLEHLCDCTVRKLADGGIPDPKGPPSGDLYVITRPVPRIEGGLYALVEVYEYERRLELDFFEQICLELGVPQSRARGTPN
jgi:hypothetical protein